MKNLKRVVGTGTDIITTERESELGKKEAICNGFCDNKPSVRPNWQSAASKG